MVSAGYPNKRSTRSLLRDRSGNVAMMWGLMGTVLIGLIGITVDFTRAQSIRNTMQNAADGAALVAERSSNLSMSARTAAARAFFDAEVGDMIANVNFNVVQMPDGGHRVDVSAPMPVSLASLVNDDDWMLRVAAEAQASASPPIEVALVLDNTGSMAADMDALRSAASDLADDLLSIDGDSVRVALVPFVAQVNIGNQQSHMAWMDHGRHRAVQWRTARRPHDRIPDEQHDRHQQTNNAYTGNQCQALSTRPYFDNPSTGADESYPGPYRVVWQRGNALLQYRCFAFTPDDDPAVSGDGINYFTLFDLLSMLTGRAASKRARAVRHHRRSAESPDPVDDVRAVLLARYWRQRRPGDHQHLEPTELSQHISPTSPIRPATCAARRSIATTKAAPACRATCRLPIAPP